MLPDTIWVGPFWTCASIRPGGSGWITALITPPSFGSCACAIPMTQPLSNNATATRFNITTLPGAGPARFRRWDTTSVHEIRIAALQHALERRPFDIGSTLDLDAVSAAGILSGGFQRDRFRRPDDLGAGGLQRQLGAARPLHVVHQLEGFGDRTSAGEEA